MLHSRYAILPAVVVPIALGIASCKTTEANYRAAYEKAIAGRDSLTALENTIYGRHRRNIETRVAVEGTDTVDLISVRVAVTPDGGGIKENLKPYSVVVGQFKQLVNAKSLRTRLADGGYPGAFVAQTAEPYYYVILSSWPTKAEAVKAAAAVRAAGSLPVALRDGLPLVLYTPLLIP